MSNCCDSNYTSFNQKQKTFLKEDVYILFQKYIIQAKLFLQSFYHEILMSVFEFMD